MNIIIDKKTADYIKKRGSSNVTVDIGCASWSIEPQPTVTPGEPTVDKDSYSTYDVDGITVYLSNNAKVADSGLKIEYKKVLFSEKLIVSGLLF